MPGQKGLHLTFQGHLNDCRTCPLVNQCMRKPQKVMAGKWPLKLKYKNQFTFLDIMKSQIDNEEGRYIYSKRMHTIGR